MKALIIIPLRDSFKNGERWEELKVLRERIDEICKVDNQDYKIYVIYQDDEQPFNKAYLMNIGAYLSKDEGDYFIFHDVDTIPINNDNVYKERPFTGVLVGNDDGQILTNRDDHFAGAVYFKKEDFFKINGFSLLYYSWGFEISNMSLRLKQMGIHWERYDGVFHQMPHETKHRYNGNPNLVNNVIICRQVELKLLDGYSDIEVNINRVDDYIYYVKLPKPQYDVTKILTIEDIKNMVGECDEKDYEWTIATYKK